MIDNCGATVVHRSCRRELITGTTPAFELCARALMADVRILVLDEATASIHSYTEILIQKALKTLLKWHTGFVIAHCLATIRHADKIIILQIRIAE